MNELVTLKLPFRLTYNTRAERDFLLKQLEKELFTKIAVKASATTSMAPHAAPQKGTL